MLRIQVCRSEATEVKVWYSPMVQAARGTAGRMLREWFGSCFKWWTVWREWRIGRIPGGWGCHCHTVEEVWPRKHHFSKSNGPFSALPAVLWLHVFLLASLHPSDDVFSFVPLLEFLGPQPGFHFPWEKGQRGVFSSSQSFIPLLLHSTDSLRSPIVHRAQTLLISFIFESLPAPSTVWAHSERSRDIYERMSDSCCCHYFASSVNAGKLLNLSKFLSLHLYSGVRNRIYLLRGALRWKCLLAHSKR